MDDIQLGVCAWGAKSLKNSNPFGCPSVRLISGRNSPAYSYSETDIGREPDKIGKEVLEIWNARVESIRDKFAHVRTVVLVKSRDFTDFAVFETETLRYPPDRFEWRKNKRNNLEGFDKATEQHRFTWQPHGSQFTILEPVPDDRLRFSVKTPPKLSAAEYFKAIGFNKSWITVVKP